VDEPVRERRAAFDPRFALGLAALGVAGAAARVAYVESVARHLKLGFDAAAYQILGIELAGGIGYANPGTFFSAVRRPTANFPPGYPLFLAGLHKLGAGSSVDIELAGAVLGAVTVVATGVLGRRVSGRAGVGLMAAALVCLSPTLMASAGSSMSESLSVPLMVLVLLAASWAARSRSVLAWVVVGVAAGCLGLVRSEDLLVAVLLVPAAVLASPGRSWRWRGAGVGLALVSALAVVTPWLVRNDTTFHPHVLISTATDKTLAGANCRSTYYGPLVGYWDFTCLGHDRLATSDEARYGQLLGAEGRQYVDAHLSRLVVVLPVRVLRAWGLYAPGQESHLDALETRSVGWQQVAWPVSLLTLALAVPGVVLLRRDPLALVLVAGPAVIDTAVVLISYGNDRFVLSAVPSLCIAAALTLIWVGRRLAGGPARRGALGQFETGAK